MTNEFEAGDVDCHSTCPGAAEDGNGKAVRLAYPFIRSTPASEIYCIGIDWNTCAEALADGSGFALSAGRKKEKTKGSYGSEVQHKYRQPIAAL